MARSTSGDSIIDRTVRILQSFDARHPVLSITDLAERSDLPMSTTSRLVDQLVEHGLLERDRARRVSVGVRMWELASRASPTRGLRDVAMPFMQDLHTVIGHHVQLGVLDKGEVLFVERLSAPRAVVNYTEIAGRLPIHASSSGLVLLAHASSTDQDVVLRRPLRALTPATITDPEELRAILAQVLRRGFVLCAGHIHPDATGIAVPLRDPDGVVVAALAAIVPNDTDAYSHVVALRTAARGIEREMVGELDEPGDLATWVTRPSGQ